MDISKVKVGDVLIHIPSGKEWKVDSRRYEAVYNTVTVWVIDCKDRCRFHRIWMDMELKQNIWRLKDINPLEVY